MTEHDDAGTLARRHLIRGGAVLAGAAGLSAVGAALAPKATAADNQALVQGQANTGTLTTTIATSTAAAALRLANTSSPGGPVLSLAPRANVGDNEVLSLAVGEIVNTPSGPYIGVSNTLGGTSTPAYLPTNFDLDQVPAAAALEVPVRILDTRNAATRIAERASVSAPFDSAGRLKAGVWIDVAVDEENLEYVADGAFFNLTALGALKAGYLTAYPPVSSRPNVSAVNYVASATSANSGFVKLGVYASLYVVRIYTNQTTHVILDLSGEALLGPTAPAPGTTQRRAASSRPVGRLNRTPRKR